MRSKLIVNSNFASEPLTDYQLECAHRQFTTLFEKRDEDFYSEDEEEEFVEPMVYKLRLWKPAQKKSGYTNETPQFLVMTSGGELHCISSIADMIVS